jgi:hypothetical protein
LLRLGNRFRILRWREIRSVGGAVRASAVVIALFLSSPTLRAQTAVLSERIPELEPGTAPWDATTTVGPALVRWKVVHQDLVQDRHCVEVVFDAPGVVNAVYHIDRIYPDRVTTSLGPIGDLDLELPVSWMHDLDAIITGADPRAKATGLSSVKFAQCEMRAPHSLPSEVRVVLTGVEMDDGKAFGDAHILKERRDAQIAFRNTLQYLDVINRQAAILPGMAGFVKFREYLAREDSENQFPSVPPLRDHLRNWMEEILISHQELHCTPEEFLPRLQELTNRYLEVVGKQLTESSPAAR